MSEYFAGVDLGTTFSAAAVSRDGQREMVSLGDARAAIPSVVLLREDGAVTVGEPAVLRGRALPDRLAREFKRRIGDPAPLMLGGSPIPAHVLQGRLLRWVLDRVAEREGGPPVRVAVTHPANWNRFKLDFLDLAIDHAQVPSPVVLSEPEAAAVHYASLARVEPGSLVAVYDLGGGTFDAAVLRKTDADFEIVGQPHGVEQLGGIDFDEVVFRHVAGQLADPFDDLDLADPGVLASVQQVRDNCVAAKHALSTDPDASIPVVLPGLQTAVRITRDEFERAIRPALAETVASLQRAVDSAGVEPRELSRVLLVGGSSRVPMVGQMVSAALGVPVAVDADPKNAIALGAAAVAARAGPPAPPRTTPTVAEPVPGADGPAVPVAEAPVLDAPVSEPVRASEAPGAPPTAPGRGPTSRLRWRRSLVLGGLLVVAAGAVVIGLVVAGGDGATDESQDVAAGAVSTAPAASAEEPLEPVEDEEVESGAPPTALNVAADGSGDAPTLAEAVELIAAGGTITLGPGSHDVGAGIEISRDVALVGAGVDATEIIGGAGGPVVRFVGPATFTVRSLGFRYTGNDGNVVEVESGFIDFSECAFTGGVSRVNGAAPFGQGLFVSGDSAGEVSGCRAAGNAEGFSFVDRAVVDVVGSEATNNDIAGFVYGGESAGIARSNRITANLQGIELITSAAPVLEGNVIDSNRLSGIVYRENAGGSARTNEVQANEADGIEVTGSAAPLLEQNTIRDNRESGLRFAETAGGDAAGNEVAGNGVGITVEPDADPTLRDNDVRDNLRADLDDQRLGLRGDGLGVVDFGQPADEVLATFDLLGSTPALDDPAGTSDECPGVPVRIVSYAPALVLVFADPSGSRPEGEWELVEWAASEGSALTDPFGIGPGDTFGDLLVAHPEGNLVELEADTESEPPTTDGVTRSVAGGTITYSWDSISLTDFGQGSNAIDVVITGMGAGPGCAG